MGYFVLLLANQIRDIFRVNDNSKYSQIKSYEAEIERYKILTLLFTEAIFVLAKKKKEKKRVYILFLNNFLSFPKSFIFIFTVRN